MKIIPFELEHFPELFSEDSPFPETPCNLFCINSVIMNLKNSIEADLVKSNFAWSISKYDSRQHSSNAYTVTQMHVYEHLMGAASKLLKMRSAHNLQSFFQVTGEPCLHLRIEGRVFSIPSLLQFNYSVIICDYHNSKKREVPI